MKFQLWVQSLSLIHVNATSGFQDALIRCLVTFINRPVFGHQAVLCKDMYIKLTAHALYVGQLLIVHTIRSFGALVFATIMTTRQFVSVLASCIIFAHPLSPGQW